MTNVNKIFGKPWSFVLSIEQSAVKKYLKKANPGKFSSLYDRFAGLSGRIVVNKD